MSDNWLQYIPGDPTFQPSHEQAEKARSLLASYVPDADEVSVAFTETIEFFDPGANWSGVTCPACGADAEPWWLEAMDAASHEGFSNLFVTAQCCGKRVSLNELHYNWPCAFGRFALQAMNPNVRELTPAQESALAETVGHGLRKVWMHL
ncbi:hypothetical protein [Dyella mobilis]|uniref:Phage protein n=1 Tax=Dyella mobilis TaxID=1849582 RepID=A0ABS2KJU8_9GAMM|nr:hypothetical protein [Dyella mobilis]MBM7131209.1 hypothetical protein [Dyella mobilis]GLQ98856.1 hypothetical protein GCM10007863_32760 [Dyella mobilis]